MERASVVIIGGGVYGTSIAYHLAAMGCGEVVLLEKDSLACGSSGKSCALVRQHYSNEITARAAMESRKFFEVFEEEVGGFPEYKNNGMIFLAHPPEAEALEKNVKLQQEVGIEVEVINPGEVEKYLQGIDVSDIALACFESSAGYADPHGVVTAFGARAKQLGAKICQGRAATGIEISGGAVKAVHTAEGTIETEVVVNAAGPWGEKIAAMAGLDIPLKPTRIQEAIIRPLETYDKLTPTLIDPGEALYFRPETGGLVMAGGGTSEEDKEFDPDDYNENADSDFVEDISQRLSHRSPRLERAGFMRGWAGLITLTPDYHPILGEAPEVKGLIWCNGFSGHGFKLSPVIGKAIAELIFKGKAEAMDLEPFHINRYAEGRTFASTYENFPILA